MTAPGSDFAATWSQMMAEITRGDSSLPHLTVQDKAWLRQVHPVGLMGTIAVVTVPNTMVKETLERKLVSTVSDILTSIVGQPVTVAISVDPAQPTQPPQPTQPTQPAPTEYSYHRKPVDPSLAGYSDSAFVGETDKSDDYDRWNEAFIRSNSEPDSDFDSRLNPQYTFETFVTGSSNRYANAAAVAVAENPATSYNPLFIWGDSGLGKTHLLHATGHYAMRLHPGIRVRYVSSEEFTNEWINSLRDHKGEAFKKKYRDLDILIVDDIQFLAGKEGTQEEFFHTFNALYQAGKQIVLSSDRLPNQLTTLEDRLRTRFEGGLTTDIQAPDLETRIAILSLKARRDHSDVPREVLEFIASQNVPSVRELEGLLTRVAAIASLDDNNITIEVAENALQGIIFSNPVEITSAMIMTTTADYFNLTLDQLTGPSKARPVALARQIAMYLCRELTDDSLPTIGNTFGGRDHTTAMYAEKKIRKEMGEKRSTYETIQELTLRIKNGAK